jgi:hypothetical protein
VIRFDCPKCGAKLKSPEGTEGRKSRCKCGQPIVVPSPIAAAVHPIAPLPQPRPPEPLPPPAVRGISAICPHCRNAGVVPHELIGQPIRCGHCHAHFAIAATSSLIVPPPGSLMPPPPAPPRELIYEEEPRRRRRRIEYEDDDDDRPRRPMLIEQTSKTFKAHMLVGAGIAIVGVFMMCGGAGATDPHSRDPNPFPFIGLLMLLLGLLWFMIAKVGAWWHHG